MVPVTLLRLKPERPGEPVNTLPLMLTCVPVVPFQLPAMNTASKLPPDDVTPVMLLFVSVTLSGPPSVYSTLVPGLVMMLLSSAMSAPST